MIDQVRPVRSLRLAAGPARRPPAWCWTCANPGNCRPPACSPTASRCWPSPWARCPRACRAGRPNPGGLPVPPRRRAAMQVAQFLAAQGFAQVANIAGGIDAWSPSSTPGARATDKQHASTRQPTDNAVSKKDDHAPPLRLLPISLALLGGLLPRCRSAPRAWWSCTRRRGATTPPTSRPSSQYEADLARAEQARAGILLPTVGLAASMSRTTRSTPTCAFPTRPSARKAPRQRVAAAVPAGQPATYEQGQKRSRRGQAQLQLAEQDLIVRVSQAYFDVLAAQDALAFVQAQEDGRGRATGSAKRNFEVGTSTITDTREAQARFDLVVAQEIAAANDLLVKSWRWTSWWASPGTSPSRWLPPVVLPALLPDDVNLPGSTRRSTSIRCCARPAWRWKWPSWRPQGQAGHKPTLDLNGSYGMTHNDGNNVLRADSRTNNAVVGWRSTCRCLPGLRSRTASRKPCRWKTRPAPTWRPPAARCRRPRAAAFFGVVSGQGQVKALEAPSLQPERAGRQQAGLPGGRAHQHRRAQRQSQLFQTKRDLAQARYDVLLGGLRLRQANGTLKPKTCRRLRASWQTAPPARRRGARQARPWASCAGVGRGVELEVAQHATHRGAELAQALRRRHRSAPTPPCKAA
jgi:outer membrane protein